MAGTGTAVTWPESGGLVVVALSGPNGGHRGAVDLTPDAARELADELRDAADDAEGETPAVRWNVETRTPDGNTEFYGVRARDHRMACERAARRQMRQFPDNLIVRVTEATY